MKTAEKLILEEAFGEKGLPTMARMGECPSSDRINAVIKAIKVLYDSHKGKKTIDRQLALALYTLSYHTEAQILGWQSRGVKFHDDLFEPDLYSLSMAVESFLQDEWMEL